MSDKKVTSLSELTNPDSGDYLHIVDISDTTDDQSGTSKKIKLSNLPSSQVFVTVGTDQYSDYVCDGTDDEVQIQEAIDYVDSLGGGIVFLKRGIYNIDDYQMRATVKCGLLIGSSSGERNNIHLIGEGRGATTIKYRGDDMNGPVVSSWGQPSDPDLDPDANQTDISISNLTVDCNGKAESGIYLQYCKHWEIENVKVKNTNIFGANNAMFGVGIYSNSGVIKNLWIDPPLETATTVGGQNELLSCMMLFDSVYCYDVIAKGIIIDGGGVSIAKGGISFEDHPQNIQISDFIVKNTLGDGIAITQSYTGVKKNLRFSNFQILDCGGFSTPPIDYSDIVYENFYVRISAASNTWAFYCKADNVVLANGTIDASLGTTYTTVCMVTTSDNVKIKGVTIIPAAAGDGITIADGCTNCLISGSTISSSAGKGIDIRAVGGGTAPNYTTVVGCHVHNNTGTDINDAGSNTINQHNQVY